MEARGDQVKGGRRRLATILYPSQLAHSSLVFWAQTTELETRSQSPGRLTFSPDGSLLAVAHPAFITLHNASSADLTLMDTVSCSEVRSISKITFVGERGRWLACVGQHELVLWDVIRSCGAFSIVFPLDALAEVYRFSEVAIYLR